MDPKQTIQTAPLIDQGAQLNDWETERTRAEADAISRREIIAARYIDSPEYDDDVKQWLGTLGSIPTALIGPARECYAQSSTFATAIDDRVDDAVSVR